ncbi:MAG: DUF1700 domain-containing protein [Treponema sp.]|nr:DUF1700 domain-containing protein [Treponema sp.]
MTREEYLSALKGNLNSLSEDEKAEALQYYSDFFEDANDDQKVMDELGNPEELAAKIKEDFSNALVKTSSEKSNEEEEITLEDSENFFASYNAGSVSKVELNLGACHAVAIPGKTWKIETRGIRKDNFTCNVSGNKLHINSVKKRNFLDFLNHEPKNKMVPRILITIPEGTSLEEMKVQLGAGLFETKDVSVFSNKLIVNIGAGNLILNGFSSACSELKCAMGNVELKGDLKGRTNIDCGMGAVTLRLAGKPDDYSLDCKVGLGEVRFNDTKYAGVQNVNPSNRKENHISINCGMGSVNCKTN